MGVSKTLLFLLVLVSAACSNIKPAKDMGEIYSLALDAYMPIDRGLNESIQYIAIDMGNFRELDESDKQQIIKHFEKYNVRVMEATYDQLRADGLMDPSTKVLTGLLLRVDKTVGSAKQIVVEGSKYRAGDGAIGTKVVIEYKHREWKVTRADSTWIS